LNLSVCKFNFYYSLKKVSKEKQKRLALPWRQDVAEADKGPGKVNTCKKKTKVSQRHVVKKEVPPTRRRQPTKHCCFFRTAKPRRVCRNRPQCDPLLPPVSVHGTSCRVVAIANILAPRYARCPPPPPHNFDREPLQTPTATVSLGVLLTSRYGSGHFNLINKNW
jgi:hypothetical protein